MGSSLPLRVSEVGRTGRPLVLLHGFGAHSFTWRHWIPSLAASHRLHLVDLMGHGGAPAPPRGDYSPRGHARLVHRYVQDRDLHDVTLTGHSLGGGVALLAALELLKEDPGRLDSLVLISAASLPQDLPRFIGLARIPVVADALLPLVPPEWLVRKVLRSIVHDPDDVEEDQIEAYAAPFRTRKRRRAVLETARTIVPPDLDELVARYSEIDVPTLLLWGAGDPVVPVHVARGLRDLLPRSELHLLERCGHVPQEEIPDRALAPLRAFLAKRPSGSSTGRPGDAV